MFERFTTQARQVVVGAKQEARDLRHSSVGTEHLLLAMLDEGSGIAHDVLTAAGLDRDRVRGDVERLVGTTAPVLGQDDAEALQSIGIDLDAVRAKIEEVFGPGALEELIASPPPAPRRRGLLRRREQHPAQRVPRQPFTPRAKKVLELSLREAIRLGHRYIGSEHILLGVIREGEGLGAKILFEAGLNLGELRGKVLAALPKAA